MVVKRNYTCIPANERATGQKWNMFRMKVSGLPTDFCGTNCMPVSHASLVRIQL